MKKNLRKQQILKRKNFLPSLIFTVILWGLLGGLIYFIDPFTFGVIPVFFVLSFLSILFTFSLIFASSRRGFIISASVTLFLVLGYLGIGNLLNLFLILAIAISVELYFSLR